MTNDKYEAVIGLEVHAHMLTRSKLFCGCAADFGAPPNHNVCPVCMAMPGVLPVLNRHVLELAIRTGLAAHSKIGPYAAAAISSFRRARASSRAGFAWCEFISKKTPARISMPRMQVWSISTARACRWLRPAAVLDSSR